MPFKNIEEVIYKSNRYSTLGAIKLQNKGKVGSVFKAFLHGFWSFIKHYFLKLGFLDGGAGFVIAFGNFEGTFSVVTSQPVFRHDRSHSHCRRNLG